MKGSETVVGLAHHHLEKMNQCRRKQNLKVYWELHQALCLVWLLDFLECHNMVCHRYLVWRHILAWLRILVCRRILVCLPCIR
jgi:hypothetical protein